MITTPLLPRAPRIHGCEVGLDETARRDRNWPTVVQAWLGPGMTRIREVVRPPIEAGRDGPTARPRKSLRILLVEDEPNHLKLAQQALEDGGHEVVAASDGATAYGLVTTRGFDLVILDMRMPVMDGNEFINRVRSSDGPAAVIPIIVVTGYGVRQHLDSFQRAGIEHYINKPYDCDLLLEKVRFYE